MNKIFRLFSSLISAVACSGTLSIAFAASYTTDAVSDAFVATGPAGNLSNNNYGGGGALTVAASGLPNGEFQSVIKFDLSGARSTLDAQYGTGQWSIESVSLQLSSAPHNNAIFNDVAAGLFSVSLMQNNSWMEGSGNASNPANNGITFHTLQSTFINSTSDETLGTFSFHGGTSGANSYSLDLSSQLAAGILTGGDVSLRLFAADNNVSYLFSSRAATAASNQPQLIVTAVPEPGCLALFGLGFGVLLSRRCSLLIAAKQTSITRQRPIRDTRSRR
jgi:hypothetical protein